MTVAVQYSFSGHDLKSSPASDLEEIDQFASATYAVWGKYLSVPEHCTQIRVYMNIIAATGTDPYISASLYYTDPTHSVPATALGNNYMCFADSEYPWVGGYLTTSGVAYQGGTTGIADDATTQYETTLNRVFSGQRALFVLEGYRDGVVDETYTGDCKVLFLTDKK